MTKKIEAEQTTEQILMAGLTAQVKTAVNQGHDLGDILDGLPGGTYGEIAANVVEGLDRMGMI